MQDSEIEDSPNVIIYENTGERIGPCNPSITINPENTDVILVSSLLDNVHRSLDGGFTWTTRDVSYDKSIEGDPTIVVGKDEVFHYFLLNNTLLSSGEKDCPIESYSHYSSRTNGLIWSDGSLLSKNENAQFNGNALINPRNNNLYFFWTEWDTSENNHNCSIQIKFSTSTDDGENWADEPIAITSFKLACDSCKREGPEVSSAIDIEGTLFITYAYANKIYFNKSEDGGKTWLKLPILIAETGSSLEDLPEGMKHFKRQSTIVVDRSMGPYSGRIYIIFSNNKQGTEDVYVRMSDDKGATWSLPRVVSPDAQRDQFYPAASIDPIDGQLYIVYYDRNKEDELTFDVSLAYTMDGGKTFKARVISKYPSHAPQGEIYMGNKIDIQAYRGEIRPVWTHYDGNKLSVRMALISRKPVK